ncbi:hypothetical protein OIU76_008626 [Salix suchowensis]|nr:hypothetical protein OIU76_008626 [Salix suchowensis]
MAEVVLFHITEEIINKLGSLTAQEAALWWGLKDQLPKLNDTITRIKAVIQDAEVKAQNKKQNHQIEDWLKKLREAVYDAEDLLEDFSTHVLRKQLMSGNGVLREVRVFFSRSNQFVYGLRMGHGVEALRERLNDIEVDSKRFNFEVRDEERDSLTIVREQTTSSVPEVIVGREGDKAVIKSFLLDSNYKENVSAISIIGIGGLGKTTLAQHVFNDEQVNSQFAVKHWFCVSGGLDARKILKGVVEHLRTLVLLQGGKLEGGAWESICREFRRLRVLVLSDWGIEEVPPLIEKLKHLKYLDLSNNEMEALPNSVTNLVNLQVLKLNGCIYLKELPRDINKLINLRHLDVGCSVDYDSCRSLEYMPRGIEKLTSLQTLSHFVVAKNKSPKSKMVGGLDELSRLNELRGSLEIIVKRYERDCCISEFEGAKLEDKQYLQSLTILWDIDMDSDIDLYDKMLQCLQPNSSLQKLIVSGYGGMRFPSWLSDLSNLVRIILDGCTRLEHIPPLDGIPSLKELLICSMKSLEYIDSEGGGGKEVSKFFPSLKKLVILCCPSLKGWWKKSRGEMKDDNDESTVEEELIMLSFPRLSSLTIESCSNLTSMPLFPTLDEGLRLQSFSSMPLQQTMKMKPPIYSFSSSSFIRPLSNLKELDLGFNDDMESLEKLLIDGCPRLESLSESKSQGMIPYLPSLHELTIGDYSEEPSRGWGKESEEVWPNIKHIPNIKINGHYIQKEGRYMKGI